MFQSTLHLSMSKLHSRLILTYTSLGHPNLNLSPEERQLFGQVFSAADTDKIGVVTGDVALKFFPDKTKLPSEILGEVGTSCSRRYNAELVFLAIRFGRLRIQRTKAS